MTIFSFRLSRLIFTSFNSQLFGFSLSISLKIFLNDLSLLKSSYHSLLSVMGSTKGQPAHHKGGFYAPRRKSSIMKIFLKLFTILVNNSSSIQPPDTEPIDRPSLLIDIIAPTGRGEEPHVLLLILYRPSYPFRAIQALLIRHLFRFFLILCHSCLT